MSKEAFYFIAELRAIQSQPGDMVEIRFQRRQAAQLVVQRGIAQIDALAAIIAIGVIVSRTGPLPGLLEGSDDFYPRAPLPDVLRAVSCARPLIRRPQPGLQAVIRLLVFTLQPFQLLLRRFVSSIQRGDEFIDFFTDKVGVERSDPLFDNPLPSSQTATAQRIAAPTIGQQRQWLEERLTRRLHVQDRAQLITRQCLLLDQCLEIGALIHLGQPQGSSLSIRQGVLKGGIQVIPSV
ncbi:hypothetical protein D3C84_546270 [compost metagenome]